jgi:glycosyltransferase involved in cell wall biosynthesis
LGTGAGVLTSPDPEALAKAILDLLEDPKRRAEMGAVGRDKVAAEFSVERMVRSYQEVYRELASLAPKS